MPLVAAPLLQLIGIAKHFGAIRALKGVSFTLQPGEVHALLGENGAGKSTLIKVITGAHAPDAGTISVDGEPHPRLSPARAHQLGIACIYQQPALFPDLTVAENLALALEPSTPWRWLNWRARRARAVELLARVGARISPEAEVHTLSMPEQQLVEIAKALGAGARILLMDEPSASLTHAEVELLLGLVQQLRREGVGIVYISHRLEEIARVADRVTILRDGESVVTREVSGTREAELIHLMVGRAVEAIYPPALRPPGAQRLVVHGLTCAAGGLENVSFEVRAGEIFGLAGLVGAGRTELARTLFGLTPPEQGTVEIDGALVLPTSPRAAMAAGLAYVPEDRRRHGVVLPMALSENMLLASHERFFPGGWLRPSREAEAGARYLTQLGIKAPHAGVPGGTLSGGNQQKVALARWLATEPKVLILDEPTQGVDVGAKAEIHRIIRELAAQGLAVILISSDLPEVLGMSDRIGVMHAGRLTTVLEGASATAPQVMQAALGETSPAAAAA